MLSLYTLAPAYAPVTPAAPLSRAVSGVRRAAPPAAAANSVRDSIATTLLSLGLAAHLTAAPLPAFAEITKADIIAAEQKWGDGIVRVGEVYSKGGDYKMAAKVLVDSLYGYDQGPVLFKPTKASEKEFRLTPGEAYSYFVTGQEVEDKGFALHPWTKVRFDNKAFVVDGDTAFSMGNYYFTDAKTGEETKVDFTFGYNRDLLGNMRINLHHSSLPYNGGVGPKPAAPALAVAAPAAPAAALAAKPAAVAVAAPFDAAAAAKSATKAVTGGTAATAGEALMGAGALGLVLNSLL